jgi:hypothetical protein
MRIGDLRLAIVAMLSLLPHAAAPGQVQRDS